MARKGKATRRTRVGRIEFDQHIGHYCTVHGRTAKVDRDSGTESGAFYWYCSMGPRCRGTWSGL